MQITTCTCMYMYNFNYKLCTSWSYIDCSTCIGCLRGWWWQGWSPARRGVGPVELIVQTIQQKPQELLGIVLATARERGEREEGECVWLYSVIDGWHYSYPWNCGASLCSLCLNREGAIAEVVFSLLHICFNKST